MLYSMKLKTKKALLILWKIIKIIFAIGKSHEDKYLSKEDTKSNSNMGD